VPVLSVIVPAYQCAPMLRRCLAGLVASDLPRATWELLVVDDGSTDDTPAVAAPLADRVLRVPDGPRGPAQARNLGARAARSDLLVFVDADVVVAPHTLRGFADLFRADPTLAAAFGAYDDQPADPGVVSQYRNLLHRYVHLRHAGDAETFWAGCGAVRRADFLTVGGFDAARYPRPQIEDIELGYRLRDRGARIRLVPTLTGTHLKRWTLGGMLRVDLRDRAIPWTRLLLSRRTRLSHATLNLAPTEKVLTALAGGAVACVVAAVAFGQPAWLWLAAACAGIIVLGNAPLWRWLAARRGWPFALAAVPLRVLFYVVSALGAGWAVLTSGRRRPAAMTPNAADRVPEPGAPG
jgi:GT2 family glycosyltransferase